MYPRNAASPPRISIGAVVQISDGAVQTSGVAVKIIPQGGSEASGAGTVAYSADGVVLYTPTQAETNYAAMVFVASKAGCIPATATVVTSASETAGYAGIDWAKVGNPTTVVGLSSTTISTSQAVASVSGAVASVTGAVTVGTNNDKTGYSLTPTTGLGNQTATITGNLSGSVGSVTGAVGSVTSRVTANTDQWGGVTVTGMPLPTSSYTTPPTVAQVVTGVYAALPADHTVSGSYGVRLILALNAAREVKVTGAGSGHVAADVHEFQADVITAAAIAADAVTKIQAGLATLANQVIIAGYLDTEVAAIKAVTDKLNTGLVADGAVYQYTANMLELAPGGGGGGSGDASQTTLLEVQDTVESIAASLSGVPITATGRIADGGTITLYCGDDLRVRSGTQLTIQVSDVGGVIYDRLNAAGVELAWGASRRGLPASAISGTVVSLAEVGSGAAQSLAIVIEIVDGGASLQPAEDYTWQIESEQQHSTEVDRLVEVEGSLVLRRRVV